MAPIVLDRLPHTIHSLPYGVISTSRNPKPRCAVAIGDHAIDLVEYFRGRPPSQFSFDDPLEQIFAQPFLNNFATLSTTTRRAVRQQLQQELQSGNIPESAIIELKDVKSHLPFKIGGFSDFMTSLDHVKNLSGTGTTSGIAKNWFQAPAVYNSRVSSVVPTPTQIRRPRNVYFSQGVDSEPAYGPSRKLDFELEMGYFVSKPIPFGETMDIGQAKEHIFGFVMLNDWSARDHQVFEMRPLGPFHGKGFGTSISNWVVPIEALEPFSCAPHLAQDPKPFEHLTWPSGKDDGALDIKLRTKLIRDGQEHVLGTSNLKYLYWTPFQQLTHHAASGCGMATGDLIGTGTISGSGVNDKGEMSELGCLYEAERTKTTVLPPGSGRYQEGYLEDGDEIVMEGWCENGQGEIVFEFGQCRGQIVPPK